MNVVVKSSPWTQNDLDILYGDEDVIFVDDVPLPNLLKELKVVKSTSEARKNGRVGDIPKGWTEYKASKKVMLWIWNPSE